MKRRTIDDWRREVYQTEDARMSPAVKLLCVWLSDHARGHELSISVPREAMCAALGIHRARVAERLKKATEAGYLTSVSKGYLNHTAVYRATFPDVACVRLHRTHMRPAKPDATHSAPPDALNVASERESEINASGSAGRHNYSGPVPATDHRDVGIDEKGAAAPVVDGLRRGATGDREASA